MKSNFEKTLEWSEKFESHIQASPSFPPDNIIRLREKLISEEFEEYKEAVRQENVKEVASELADLLYVVYGTAIAFGIDIDAVFDEIHRANLTKLGADGKPVRRADGKIVKGPNFKRADISLIIDNQNPLK